MPSMSMLGLDVCYCFFLAQYVWAKRYAGIHGFFSNKLDQAYKDHNSSGRPGAVVKMLQYNRYLSEDKRQDKLLNTMHRGKFSRQKCHFLKT